MKDNTLVSVSKDQVSCKLDGDTVILNLKDGVYYELNSVAARLWELMETPTSIDALLQIIVREYDTTPERARQDIAKLLDDLGRYQLLIVSEGSNAAVASSS